MPEDKNGPSGFKVVDRRTFGADGSRREDEKRSDARLPSPPVSSTPDEGELEEYPESRPVGFDTLVNYLGTTAMFQLGLLPSPAGERIPPDMANARRTIDLLEVLQQKTEGNLSAEEARRLDDVLYDLRLGFVEVQKYHAKKGK